MKNEEKEQILRYIKILMKEFNTIILLLLSALFLNYFSFFVFRILFIVEIFIIGYKITQLNLFLDKLEETFTNEENLTHQESYLMSCRKGIVKKEVTETMEGVTQPIEDSDSVDESEVKEEIHLEEKAKDVLYELEKTDNKKEYINEVDYIEEVQFETSFDEVVEEIEEEKEQTIIEEEEVETVPDMDISKCIRKLPKGKKASQKAIDLAKSYGYELKEGETFVKPKK